MRKLIEDIRRNLEEKNYLKVAVLMKQILEDLRFLEGELNGVGTPWGV